MNYRLEETLWREMRIECPADWELVFASARGQPGRCSFADRRYERLKVQWRPIGAVTNIRKMLEDEVSQKREKGKKAEMLTGQPDGWYGVLEHTASGSLVHAGRVIESAGLFVEAMVIWPGKRDRTLENMILLGIEPGDKSGRWQAMGASIQVPSELDLLEYESEAGRLSWQFGPTGKKELPRIVLKRLAAPRHWLKVSLDKWLEATTDKGARVLERFETEVNGHVAYQFVTTGKSKAWDKMRGRRVLSVETAWLCPVEERVYRLTYTDISRSKSIEMPPELHVECCKPPPLV